MPEAVLVPTIATAILEVATASASEVHVPTAPVRARAIGVRVERRPLEVLRWVALVRGLGERGRRALTILRRKAIARLSHLVSLLIVKAHADRGTHERGLMTATAATEAATPTASKLRRAVLRRTRPLLRRATVRRLLGRLLGRHTVPIRLVLLELLGGLLGIILRLLVSLRGVVGVIVLGR